MRKLILLILISLTAGCTTILPYEGVPKTGAKVLVDDWYENVEQVHYYKHYYDWTPYGPIQHMCQYNDGVIVNVGRNHCP